MKQLFKCFFSVLVLLTFILEQSIIYADEVNPIALRKAPIVLKREDINSKIDPPTESSTFSNIISPKFSSDSQPSSQKKFLSATSLISLNYNNASLSDVLKALAYSYNLNIVVTKNISGKVSAQLKDLTLDDALNAILSVNGYAFMRKGGILYVMPDSDMEPIIQSVPLNYLDAKDAKDLISKATSKGSVEPNSDTNSLIVKGTPAEIENIKEVIKIVDVPPIQVLIEAKIVDINKADVQILDNAIGLVYNGAKTGIAFGKYSPTVNPIGATTSTSTTPTQIPFRDSLSGDQGALGFSNTAGKLFSEASINALVTQHKARIIASPSISTLNGREASITIGEQYPYFTSTSQNGTSTTQNTSFADIGTKLKVTPIVSPDGWITMKVHPEVSSFLGSLAAGPDISTREADATIRVKDNETIVIGGLMSKRDTRDRNGIPFLKDIPLLGHLFEGHNSDIENGELTVFITPHIIPMPDKTTKTDDKSHAVNSNIDVDMLSGLLNYADSLEGDKSKDYAKNLYLSEEQIKAYRMVLQQFPQSGKGDYCLYKIAFIYAKEFGKCDAAKDALTEMKDFSPNSPYTNVTEALVNACIAISNQTSGQ